jgi:hypothetical protein
MTFYVAPQEAGMMEEKKTLSMRTLALCILFNGVLLATFFFMGVSVFHGLELRVDPLLSTEAQKVPDIVRSGLSNLSTYIRQVRGYLPHVVFGLGGLMTLFLWLSVRFQGGRILDRSAAGRSRPEAAEAQGKVKGKEAAKPAESAPSVGSAVQILSILQRQGRFIDFLQEDLKFYDDAQIGAAVRNIHEGCKNALAECVELRPVFEEEEGDQVTIRPGFDTRAIRLTGQVTGDPPFKGELRHRGWRVVKVDLPQQVSGREKDWILAPAEVEVSG